MSQVDTNIRQSNAIFDRVLAYELGEASASERAEVESMLKDGNQDFIQTHLRVSEMLGKLPSILAPIAPPPFLKDRVMAEISSPNLGEKLPDHAPAHQPVTSGRFVNSFSLLKRSAVFAGLLIGGIVVSTYTVESLIEQSAPVHRVTLTQPQQDQAFSASQPLTQASTVDAPSAILAAPSPSMADVPSRSTSAFDQEGGSVHLQTNFGVTQAYVKLKSDPTSLEYQLAPATSAVSGEGRVMWGESYEDALVVVSKLQATGPHSHYVLWYTRDRGLPDRMLEFSAASGTPLSFFVNHAPSSRVTGVVVTLERNEAGKIESQEVLRSSIKQKVD